MSAVTDPYNREHVPTEEEIREVYSRPEVKEIATEFLDLDPDAQVIVAGFILRVLAAHCGRMSGAKGFHDSEVGMTIDRRLLLAVGELVEAQDEIRDGHAVGDVRYRADGKPEGFVMELADTIIRVMDLAYVEGLDIGAALVTKVFFNSTREHRHGKSF